MLSFLLIVYFPITLRSYGIPAVKESKPITNLIKSSFSSIVSVSLAFLLSTINILSDSIEYLVSARVEWNLMVLVSSSTVANQSF